MNISQANAHAFTRASWYVLGVLVLAYLLALVDRQILTLLVHPIRRDLGLSDTELSLLIGLAFVVLYTIVGIPIASLADKKSRKLIIAVGVFVWSVMTFLCGLSNTYWQLFWARVGVGIGEAALQPAAYSMLADLFPADKLGRAIGIYSSGLFMGGGLALIVGGGVVGALSGTELQSIPLLGEFRPWQTAFLVVAIPGVFLSILMMTTVTEPPRGGVSAAGALRSQHELRAYLKNNASTVSLLIAAFSFGGIVVVGYMAWIPEFLRRSFGMRMADTGLIFGILMAVFGTIGTLIGGWFVDYLAKKGHVDAPIRASVIAFGGLAPAAVLAPLMPSAELSFLVLAVFLFFVGMQQGYSPTAFQLIVPNQVRARVIAIYFFIAQIVALGIGPTIVALVTEKIFRDENMLAYSLSWVGGIAGLIGLMFLLASRRPYRYSAAELRR